jgi:hypothetical protein
LNKDFDKLWLLQLYKEYQNIVFQYSLRLQPVVIVISSSVQTHGMWCHETRKLSISRQLIVDHSWSVVVGILKHEIAHQYVEEIMQITDSHGPSFQRACEIIRVPVWARRASIDLTKLGSDENYSLSKEQQRVVRLVKKLFALSESSNTNEASEALKKAKDFCMRYSLESSEISASTHNSDFIIYVVNHKKKKLLSHQHLICDILMKYFFVQVIYSSSYCSTSACEFKTIDIIGGRAQVKIAEYIYWFLFNQSELLWPSFKGREKKGLREKNSFLRGLFHGFDKKLSLQDVSTNKNSVQEKALINNKTSQALSVNINKYISYHYPRLSRSYQTNYFLQGDSYYAGREQGKKLKIHEGLNSRDKKPRDIKRITAKL